MYLGSVPIDPKLTSCYENGGTFLESLKDSGAYGKFKEITNVLIA